MLQTEILTSKYPHSCPLGNPFTLFLDRNTMQAGLHKDVFFKPGVLAHNFNPSTQETEAGGSLSLRPVWSTE